MNFLLLGITLGTIGKLVIGIAVLRVHIYILREHKIDTVVLKALKREQYITIFGLFLIVLGFLCEIYFYGSGTDFLSCSGNDCTGLIQNAFTK